MKRNFSLILADAMSALGSQGIFHITSTADRKRPSIATRKTEKWHKSNNTLSQKGRRKRQRQQRSQSYKKGGAK